MFPEFTQNFPHIPLNIETNKNIRRLSFATETDATKAN